MIIKPQKKLITPSQVNNFLAMIKKFSRSQSDQSSQQLFSSKKTYNSKPNQYKEFSMLKKQSFKQKQDSENIKNKTISICRVQNKNDEPMNVNPCIRKNMFDIYCEQMKNKKSNNKVKTQPISQNNSKGKIINSRHKYFFGSSYPRKKIIEDEIQVIYPSYRSVCKKQLINTRYVKFSTQKSPNNNSLHSEKPKFFKTDKNFSINNNLKSLIVIEEPPLNATRSIYSKQKPIKMENMQKNKYNIRKNTAKSKKQNRQQISSLKIDGWGGNMLDDFSQIFHEN